MAKDILLNFKINGVEQAEQLGNNLEKLTKGAVDAGAGIALAFGASEQSAEKLQKSFVKIIGVAQGLKGGIEAVSASMKVLGGPLTAVIAAAAALYTVFMVLTDNSDEVSESINKQTAAHEALKNILKQEKGFLDENQRLQLELAKANGLSAKEMIKLQQIQNVEKQNFLEKESSANQKRIEEIRAISEKEKELLGDGGESLNKELEQRLNDEQKYVLERKKLNNNFLIFQAQLANERKKIEEQEKAEEAKNLEDRKKKWKEFKDFRVQIARQIRDLEISLIENEDEAEIAKVNEKYNRIIEDTKKNEKILQSEKEKIIKLAEQNRAKELDDIEKKKKNKEEENNKKNDEQIGKDLAKIKEANDEISLNNMSAKDREILSVQNKYDSLIELAKKYGIDTTFLEEEKEKQIADINKKYADAELSEHLKKVNKKINDVEHYVSSVSSLTKALFEISNNIGKQDEKSKLERAKRQFKIQKAFSAVEAGINTAKAITKAIGDFGPPPSPLGILGIVSAGVIGAAQIAAILSKKFEGGESSSISTGGASVSGGAASVQPQPTFNPQLFSTGAQSEQTISANKQPAIRAYVVEQEITSTQKRIQQIQERASL